jgi:hypothetical protein
MANNVNRHWKRQWKRVAVGAAVIALLTAGSATAAGLITGADIKDGTITSADIKDGTVQGRDIRNGTITSADIKDGTVQGRDIRNGTITSADIKDGTVSPADMQARTLPTSVYGSWTWTVTETGDWVFIVWGLVAPTDVDCHVVTSMQWTDGDPVLTAGDTGVDVRVGAYLDDGSGEYYFGDDGQPFDLVKASSNGPQPPLTRSATFWVARGESFGFGLSLDNIPTAMVGDTVRVQTSATCSPSGWQAYAPMGLSPADSARQAAPATR